MLESGKEEKVFNTICSVFEKKKWKYEKNREKLYVKSGFSSKDFPVEFSLRIHTKNELVSLVSKLPFQIEEKKRTDIAIAVAVANQHLIDGAFLYDVENGVISFKLTSNYKDSTLGEGLFEFVIACALKTIDDYNDKFYLISKGMLELKEFMQAEKRKRG